LGRISTHVDDNPCLVSALHERDAKVNKSGRFLEEGTLSARTAPTRELIKRNLQEAAIKFRGYHRKRSFKPDNATKNRRGFVGGLEIADIGAQTTAIHSRARSTCWIKLIGLLEPA
jgi:hypothetical protein